MGRPKAVKLGTLPLFTQFFNIEFNRWCYR